MSAVTSVDRPPGAQIETPRPPGAQTEARSDEVEHPGSRKWSVGRVGSCGGSDGPTFPEQRGWT